MCLGYCLYTSQYYVLLHEIWGSEKEKRQKERKNRKERIGLAVIIRLDRPLESSLFFLVALVLLASKAQDPVSTSCQIYMTTRLDSTWLIDT